MEPRVDERGFLRCSHRELLRVLLLCRWLPLRRRFLYRAKAEVWREAATHVLTCMHAVDAANDFDACAAQIEEGE